MNAGEIYNDASSKLINLATELLIKITKNIRTNRINVTDYDVDLTNVIVWGEDESYDEILAKGFDIEVIYFDGKNIEIYNEEEYRNFFELPLNSMVFVINGLEEILKQTK